MGEYIEPSAASWVSDVAQKPDDSAWSDCVAVLPEADQEQILVLAWVLLLHRGTVQSEDGAFSWERNGKVQEAPIKDVIEGEDASLGLALQAIRRLGEFSEVGDIISFKNTGTTTQVSVLAALQFLHFLTKLVDICSGSKALTGKSIYPWNFESPNSYTTR